MFSFPLVCFPVYFQDELGFGVGCFAHGVVLGMEREKGRERGREKQKEMKNNTNIILLQTCRLPQFNRIFSVMHCKQEEML